MIIGAILLIVSYAKKAMSDMDDYTIEESTNGPNNYNVMAIFGFILLGIGLFVYIGSVGILVSKKCYKALLLVTILNMFGFLYKLQNVLFFGEQMDTWYIFH